MKILPVLLSSHSASLPRRATALATLMRALHINATRVMSTFPLLLASSVDSKRCAHSDVRHRLQVVAMMSNMAALVNGFAWWAGGALSSLNRRGSP